MNSRAERATRKARKGFEPWEWSGSMRERGGGQWMGDGWRFLRKLSECGGDELRVRGAQAFAAWAERHGLSPEVRVPGDAALFRTLDLGRIGRDVVSAERLL